MTQEDPAYDYNAQDSYLDFKYDNLAALKEEISKYSRDEITAHNKKYLEIKNNPEYFKKSYMSRLSDNLNPQDKRLLTDLAYVQVMMVGVIGLIAALPEDISKWDKSELAKTSLGERWRENVRKGPVIDHDDWTINYIGHRISGPVYYVWGKERGLPWQKVQLLGRECTYFM